MEGLTFRTLIRWIMEFGPILTFAVTFNRLGFFYATLLLVIFTGISLVVSFVEEKGRIPIFPLFTGSLVIIFGVGALLFHNPHYLVREYTFYNSVFAIAIFAGLLRRKFILKVMFDDLFAISDKGWYMVSIRFFIFFFATAILSEAILFFEGFHEWILFRTVIVPIVAMFTLLQLPIARRERLPEANEWGFRK